MNLALARYDFEEPPLLSDEEIAGILDKKEEILRVCSGPKISIVRYIKKKWYEETFLTASNTFISYPFLSLCNSL